MNEDTLRQEIQEILQNIQNPALLQSIKEALVHEAKAFQDWKEENSFLKAKNQKFSSIISIEVGSPLNSLKMISEMLKDDAQNLDKNGILSYHAHLHNLILSFHDQMQNLIEWCSLEIGNYILQIQKVELTELIKMCIQKYQKQAENKGISIHLNPSQAFWVQADKTKIPIVIDNLVSNAIKFSLKEATIHIDVIEENQNIKIKIVDTGIGMGAAKIKSIFAIEKPSTQKGTANEKCLGLGLPVSQKILSLHASALEVSSERGKGSCFAFALPKSE